ncbi:uracil-DNA glycosylase [Saccharothrix sp. 6-C]|uniref:uracil-DNA glycosylase n=1 Tax=Saccharothrix sp. 6-C TaxID=2781735 RepID=UPI001916F915|nr:uracil-DNA glycosylase [Saccharothrix sp. 6-C]QQQ75485.1 uracil-DNA glycosylase [Saccharothrix sp. 6-C]
MPARANRLSAVVRAKHARLSEPHIAPFVALADEIAAARGLTPGEVPYPDPEFAGTAAQALVLLQSPGPKTSKTTGSGLLSLENDDPSAQRCYDEYRRAGLDWHQVLHWNTVPWPTASTDPSGKDLRDARPWLPRLLALLPEIKAVLLLGRVARDEWRRAATTELTRMPLVPVFIGPHPSQRGMARANAKERLSDAIEKLAGTLSTYPRENRV